MKLICVGRNYAEHAKELKNEVPTEPVIFLKPDTAVLRGNAPFLYPDFSTDIHHELEVIFQIGKPGYHIAPEFAAGYVSGIGLGIDFTARDLQTKFKAKGLPWELAKGFVGSAPISELLPPERFGPWGQLTLELRVNGETRQQGTTADWLFPLEQVIAYVSQYYKLLVGDLIFTGTPAGVGPVQVGDHLEGFLNGEKLIDMRVE